VNRLLPTLGTKKKKEFKKSLKNEGARKEKPRILHLMLLGGRVAQGL
jgi:hypothetical protein